MRKLAFVSCTLAFLAAAFCALFLFCEEQGVLSKEVADALSFGSASEVQQADDFPNVDWAYWKGVNEDVVGWVSVPGTNIDAPIVQASADGPSYYLDHDIRKNYNKEGCAFLDAECADLGLLSTNSVIFGHHLRNRKGFADFAQYLDEDFAQEHGAILLQTPSWKKVLKVIGVELTEGSSKTKITSFANDDQYRVWLQERLDACVVRLDGDEKADEKANYAPDRVWTFCTCSYTRYSDERTLVYAAEREGTSAIEGVKESGSAGR